ncbi:predicted protein [Arabidopsis lyrata subsp. lyrata]|uniref:Predicted protein n=1 Tax=Arabidopsis lyrata subsp. lyrata TaxID=81972 RepID=D7MGW0_ARALL|nr:predicted protein [Arabidopsis lyrata subsp. lyrata]
MFAETIRGSLPKFKVSIPGLKFNFQGLQFFVDRHMQNLSKVLECYMRIVCFDLAYCAENLSIFWMLYIHVGRATYCF